MAARAKTETIATAELIRLRRAEIDGRKLRAELDHTYERIERAKVTIGALQTEIMRRPLCIGWHNPLASDDEIPF